MMNTLLALLFILVGGAVNGSFALPTKYIKHWYFENIWSNYIVWAFLILPWAVMFIIEPHAGIVYRHLPVSALLILIIGGIAFGIGQACFAQALKIIGFGLGFVINIGLGTGLGFLLPLVILHPEKIPTLFGLTTLIGIIFIIAGLIVSYLAGRRRDQHTKQFKPTIPPAPYQVGVWLAVVAGFCSALQNFAFASTHNVQVLALNHRLNHLACAMIIWPVFLSFSFVPYVIYMLFLLRKNRTFKNFFSYSSGMNFLLTSIMALCWYCSLILYSQASLMIGNLGPVVGWPLFMVLIILVANFWGWRHHEWAHVTTSIARQALLAIGLLILAVIVLAYSATLS
ncbi:MAG: hypothetical protein JSR33_08805 [Proteobacteria bacterium]|nr:hypothetical protein [Pseudomonadota bacterium]